MWFLKTSTSRMTDRTSFSLTLPVQDLPSTITTPTHPSPQSSSLEGLSPNTLNKTYQSPSQLANLLNDINIELAFQGFFWQKDDVERLNLLLITHPHTPAEFKFRNQVVQPDKVGSEITHRLFHLPNWLLGVLTSLPSQC